MEAPRKSPPKFWMAVQPTIIRLYKVAGLLALTAILVGLIGFLIVNIFYFFDHTWVKPVVLTPNHPKVVEASNLLNDAKSRAAQFTSDRLEAASELEAIDRVIAADDAFLTEVGTQADAPKTPEQWLLRREVEKTRLDKENQNGRRAPLKARLTSLEARLADQELILHKLEQSPYLRASGQGSKVVLAFVPYSNQRNINEKQQTKLYACSWGLVMCHVVGRVKSVIEGETTDTHPHDESVQRGFMVEVEMTTPSAEGEPVLFAGSKPLWLF